MTLAVGMVLRQSEIDDLRAQLAAKDATIARLREALDELDTRLAVNGFGPASQMRKIIAAALTEEQQ